MRLANGKALTKARAKELLGKQITITTKVRATGMAKTLVFLNSAADRLHKDNFTIVIRKSAQIEFANNGVADLRKHFGGKTIRVTGRLSQFRGRPQIMVTAAKQINVVK